MRKQNRVIEKFYAKPKVFGSKFYAGLRVNRPKKLTDQVIARPLPSNNRSSIRKQWSNEQMQAALNSVVCDGISANKAAPQHRVSRSTLKDRLSGRVVHGRNPGSEPYLNVEEEQELVAI